MARYRGPVCRLCRREGMKLFLKGERCYTDKCAIERRSYPPGEHGQSRRQKVSPYGQQLREKQKVKRAYGMRERQFRRFVDLARRSDDDVGRATHLDQIARTRVCERDGGVDPLL